jgi:hypothetical protein
MAKVGVIMFNNTTVVGDIETPEKRIAKQSSNRVGDEIA